MTKTAEEAIRNAHAWFEVNSGWAPPDEDNLAEWVADGVCRCPDECVVALYPGMAAAAEDVVVPHLSEEDLV